MSHNEFKSEQAPFVSMNSFEIDWAYWQTVPDIQKFITRSWNFDNNFAIRPQFVSSNGSRYGSELSWNPSKKHIDSSFSIYAKNRDHSKFTFHADSEDLSLHLDGGTKRASDFNFNPYYSANWSSRDLSLMKLAFGFNYHDNESYTSNEVSIIREKRTGGLKLRLSNCSVMSWRVFKYFHSSQNIFGKFNYSKDTKIVTMDLGDNSILFAKMDSEEGEGEEEKYIKMSGGIQVKLSPEFHLYSIIEKDEESGFAKIIGGYMQFKDNFMGKVMVRDFSMLQVLLRYEIRNKMRLTGSVRLQSEESSEGKFNFGLKLDLIV